MKHRTEIIKKNVDIPKLVTVDEYCSENKGKINSLFATIKWKTLKL